MLILKGGVISMTVRKLIRFLQEENGDALVYLSKDAELNGFSLMDKIFSSCYVDNGELLVPEDKKDIEYFENNALRKAIILYPF